ncbi:hypothetical protein [Paenarthrobacter aurescens]|jgi:hypothetical protein|uniref:Uncharacterized protein n=1 Tax=Paenarthrobacter aurescens (strain TC1) TaxID=290340 RepID=A1R9H6_PAEAT|nr:hypothetical protein [Paenarthrobacter aurescens]ABM10110.1 hypothetical protein AAur_3191 [Paenarthrobacter aurescens TC1]
MQALVLMGFVLAAAVMWVGVIIMMLAGLHRAERRGHHEAPEPSQERDSEKYDAPPTRRA